MTSINAGVSASVTERGEPMAQFNKRYAAAKADILLQRVARGVGLHRAYYDTREIARARVERLDIEKNRKLGLLFIHVPKCGGSSIEAQMDVSHTHRSAVYFRTADPAFFAKAWKFSIARNPYDRLVSAFHYLKRLNRGRDDLSSKGQKRSRDQAWAAEVLGPYPDFATFVDRLADAGFREQVLAWLHFQPQWYFLCDRSGRLLVDEVAHLESLDAFTERFNAAGHGLTLEAGVHKRRSERAAWPTYYDAESAARVVEMYARDFEILGYPTDFDASARGD